MVYAIVLSLYFVLAVPVYAVAGTMVADWPDAIVCPSSDGGTLVMVLGYAPDELGDYYYAGGSGTEFIGYDPAGDFTFADGFSPTECTTSIANNYAEGRAFDFINTSTTSSGTTTIIAGSAGDTTVGIATLQTATLFNGMLLFMVAFSITIFYFKRV